MGEGYAFRRSEKTALIKLNKGFFAFYGFVDYTRIDFVQRPGAAKMTGNIVDNIPPPETILVGSPLHALLRICRHI